MLAEINESSLSLVMATLFCTVKMLAEQFIQKSIKSCKKHKTKRICGGKVTYSK